MTHHNYDIKEAGNPFSIKKYIIPIYIINLEHVGRNWLTLDRQFLFLIIPDCTHVAITHRRWNFRTWNWLKYLVLNINTFSTGIKPHPHPYLDFTDFDDSIIHPNPSKSVKIKILTKSKSKKNKSLHFFSMFMNILEFRFIM